jgi:DNA primase
VRIISMPSGEDPDSLLRSGDVSKFADAIEKSLPLVDFRIKQVFRKYDLKSERGRVDALNESIRILTELENSMERERIIRHLAKYHPNFSSGTAYAEDHIRKEVIRVRNLAARNKQNLPSNIASNVKVKTALTLTEKIQRSILGEIILRKSHYEKVFDEALSNLFTVDVNIKLYNAIFNQYQTLGEIDSDNLSEYITDSDTADLLNDILISENDPDFNHPIEDLIIELKKLNANKQRRKVLQTR